MVVYFEKKGGSWTGRLRYPRIPCAVTNPCCRSPVLNHELLRLRGLALWSGPSEIHGLAMSLSLLGTSPIISPMGKLPNFQTSAGGSCYLATTLNELTLLIHFRPSLYYTLHIATYCLLSSAFVTLLPSRISPASHM